MYVVAVMHTAVALAITLLITCADEAAMHAAEAVFLCPCHAVYSCVHTSRVGLTSKGITFYGHTSC